ncbi:MAG: GerMN domain-containing protein [Patescibacteria group bacterium]
MTKQTAFLATTISLVAILSGAVGFLFLKSPSPQIGEPPTGLTIKVKAFFSNNNLDPEVTCVKVFPVDREILKTPAVGLAALRELIAGPTSAEKRMGYGTVINPGVVVQKLTIESGVASVDFNEELERQVGGSCRVSAIRAQIEETLKQFSTVKEVIISINGRTQDILQP